MTSVIADHLVRFWINSDSFWTISENSVFSPTYTPYYSLARCNAICHTVCYAVLRSKIENFDFAPFWTFSANIDEIYMQSVIAGHLVQF